MATAPFSRKLNLTRDQLAQFLTDQQQIRQFEMLFSVVDAVEPIIAIDFEFQSDTAAANANNALAQISALAQDTAVDDAVLNAKVQQALDAIPRLTQMLELLAAAPVIENNNSLVTDYIDLRDYGFQPAYRIGRVWFGPTGTLEVAMGNGNITQQVGEEFFQYGKASSAISDTNLQLVYKTGTVGASGVITFAPTVAGITDPDLIVGIATEPILNNGFGRVTTAGTVRAINTTGSVYGEVWADNDDIWYNPVTGGLTKTKPVAPNIKLMVGTVINAGPGGSGSFSVKIGSSSSLGGTDSNVQLSALQDFDLLIYDATLGYWTNKPASAVQVLEWMSM